MKVKAKFLQSGESPDFGPFKEGDDLSLDLSTARTLKKRGVVSFEDPSDGSEESDPSDDSDAVNSESAIKKED
jgi:hypothetical protein